MNFYETKNIATFGVAGNFTGHLEQAGEAADFINLKVQDKSAPKGVFPTFLPDCSSSDISKNSRITPVFFHPAINPVIVKGIYHISTIAVYFNLTLIF